jgi:hypothetical protein
VIRHHPGTVGTIPGSSLINCTWNDLMPYDLTAVPGTGSMQFEIMTHLHIFKDGQSPKKPSSAKRFYAQMLPTLPVMTNQPLKPCDGPRAGDGKYCDYSSPDAHTLNVKVSGRRCEAAAGEPAFTHSRPAATATHHCWCLHRCAVCAGLERKDAVHSGGYYTQLTSQGGRMQLVLVTTSLVDNWLAHSVQPAYMAPVSIHICGTCRWSLHRTSSSRWEASGAHS